MDLGKRNKILQVATKLFSEQGLKSTNIRQIADKAKANSALIFYYFGCKEKLFYECLEAMASERLVVAEEILRMPEDTRDFEVKLGLFARSMTEVFSKKKDLLKIMHRELDNSDSRSIKIFENHFLPVVRTLSAFFTEAQKKKIIRRDIDPTHLTMDFFSLLGNAFRNEAVVEIILKNEKSQDAIEQYRKDSASRVLEILLKGITQ